MVEQSPTPPPLEVPPLPLEELAPPIAPVRTSPAKPGVPGRKGQQNKVNREPSVGSDRYEDIIVEVRKRSLSRGNSRMGSRTSSNLDFRSSQTDFRSSNGSKVDLASLRSSVEASNRSVAAPDTDIKGVPALPSTPKPLGREPAKPPTPSLASRAPPPTHPSPPVQTKLPPTLALDGNSNTTTPTLPVVPPAPTKAAKPSEPDPLVKMFPKNIPHWFVITYTYSVVLILILLIANSTPDGKLYIHFTAFWSLILYFLLEDDQTTDLLDSVVEGFILKK